MTDETVQGDKSNAELLIEKAQATAAVLKLENDRTEQLIKRQEEILVRQALGGKSEAGSAPVAPKEETPKEYKDRIMRGG